MDDARRIFGALLALLLIAACSWINAIVVINATDAPLDVVVSTLAADHWLRGDSMYVASIEHFESGDVGAEDWQAIPAIGAHEAPASDDSTAPDGAVTPRVPPQTVVRIGTALNCRPTFDKCDRVGLVTVSLRGPHGSRTLEGAALRQAFRYERGTFALRYP